MLGHVLRDHVQRDGRQELADGVLARWVSFAARIHFSFGTWERWLTNSWTKLIKAPRPPVGAISEIYTLIQHWARPMENPYYQLAYSNKVQNQMEYFVRQGGERQANESNAPRTAPG